MRWWQWGLAAASLVVLVVLTLELEELAPWTPVVAALGAAWLTQRNQRVMALDQAAEVRQLRQEDRAHARAEQLRGLRFRSYEDLVRSYGEVVAVVRQRRRTMAPEEVERIPAQLRDAKSRVSLYGSAEMRALIAEREEAESSVLDSLQSKRLTDDAADAVTRELTRTHVLLTAEVAGEVERELGV